jgi:hypothetical protein
MIEKIRLIGLSVAASLATVGSGCADEFPHDDFAGILDLSGVDGGAPATVTVKGGFVGSKKIEYYDFGDARTVTSGPQTVGPTAPMYWFFDAENRPLARLGTDATGQVARDAYGVAALAEPPNPCIGSVHNGDPARGCDAPVVQHPIIDTIPGRSDYTAFFEVIKVYVPENYPVGAIKSGKTLHGAGFTMERPGIVLNCPVYDPTTSWKSGITGQNRLYARLRVWFRRQLATCLLVEGGEQAELALMAPSGQRGPMYPVLHDDTGTQTLIELYARRGYMPTWGVAQPAMAALPVPGNLIVEAVPGDANGMYSPLIGIYTVLVAADYKPGTITSAMQIDPALAKGPPASFKNYPVRGQIPACQTDADCNPLGLACDLTTHWCAARCAAQTDCDRYGSKCSSTAKVCQ